MRLKYSCGVSFILFPNDSLNLPGGNSISHGPSASRNRAPQMPDRGQPLEERSPNFLVGNIAARNLQNRLFATQQRLHSPAYRAFITALCCSGGFDTRMSEPCLIRIIPSTITSQIVQVAASICFV